MDRPSIDQQITFLATRDLAAAAEFYEDILELPLVLDQGTCRIYRSGPGAFLGFCSYLEVADEPRPVILTIVSQEVDAWHHYLLTKGISLAEPPVHNAAYNIYHFFLRDPDGYLLEVQQFLDPAWPPG